MSKLIKNDKCPKCLHQSEYPNGCSLCTYVPKKLYKMTRIKGRSQDLRRMR